MSVYCGYCGQRGHNRLGCPQRRADARANPDSHLARQIEREQENRARAVANRSCTYCGVKGHNRRGCSTLKSDRVDLANLQSEYLDKFANVCATKGLGPGALLKLNMADDKSILMMVTKFNWNHIDFLNDSLDLNRDYGLGNRNVLTGRVVSTLGYTGEAYWDQPPKHNSVKHLSYEYFFDHFDEIQSGTHGDISNRSYRFEIVGKMKNTIIKPPPGDLLTDHVIARFNLVPKKNAGDWEKRRLHREDNAWGKYRSRKECS